MGWVQGGARAAFATLSPGPARKYFIPEKGTFSPKITFFPLKIPRIFIYLRHHWGIVKW